MTSDGEGRAAEVIEISTVSDAVSATLRELNNIHAAETSYLADAAFLIALDQDAPYDNANFNWFRARLSRFVYVDRIVVAAGHQGQGLARRLYLALFDRARAADQPAIVCEVNLEPPNPGSDAFHERMGFRDVGQATLTTGKTVRYLQKNLESLTAD
jgi:predicted GNAT superfamily acetyltransferase